MHRSWINILLFILTLASTWLTGGPGYSIAIMLILLGHELGHYFMSRKHGIRGNPALLPSFSILSFRYFWRGHPNGEHDSLKKGTL